MNRKIGLLMAALLGMLLPGTNGAGAAAEPSYLLTAPVVTDKIQPTGSAPGQPARRLYMAMCRNEYEPAQLVVTAAGRDLEGVRVWATALRGQGSERIPAERVEVTPLGFVTCPVVTPGATLQGQVPDVLLPNRAMRVPARQRQPFFVTVQSLATDRPGEYQGSVWVEAKGCAAQRVPLVVRVFHLALPVKSHLRTAFCFQGGAQRFQDPKAPPGQEDPVLSYSRVMLTYRLSPIICVYTNDSRKAVRGGMLPQLHQHPDGSWDFSYVDKLLKDLIPRGLTTYDTAMAIGEGNGDLASVKALADHLKARGWWDLAYNYGTDEVGHAGVAAAQNTYRHLLSGVPDMKIMQTGGWLGSPEFDGLVKIWCPLTRVGADREKIRAAQAKGEEVWWYVCCAPEAPYANLFIDYPGIDHRILGWQTYRYGLQGFLYWGVDYWLDAASHTREWAENRSLNVPLPWTLEEYIDKDYAQWYPPFSKRFNGDGYLFYPGRGNLPVPSLRIALLRDGFEDYDLFKEVEALAAAHPGPAAERARKLLDLSDITPTATDYTKDGNVLLARREALLQVAEELAGSRR